MKTTPPLFELGRFALRSGIGTHWRVNAEALDETSLCTLAQLVAERLPPFGHVEGVPRGGVMLAHHLEAWADDASDTLLIVDDVLTSGGAMEEWRRDRPAMGYVIFDRSRGRRPAWIGALWTLS